MKGCYKSTDDCAPLPARLTIKQITAGRVTLYLRVLPLEDNIPTSIDPFPEDYLVTMEDKIKWSVRKLKDNHSRGPSRIR